MLNNKHHPVKRIRVSLQDKVEALLRNKAESRQVTFIRPDGSRTVQEIKEAFITGKKPNAIINDLYALQHDLGAKYFEL